VICVFRNLFAEQEQSPLNPAIERTFPAFHDIREMAEASSSQPTGFPRLL
jgi:hypothetical protein